MNKVAAVMASPAIPISEVMICVSFIGWFVGIKKTPIAEGRFRHGSGSCQDALELLDVVGV